MFDEGVSFSSDQNFAASTNNGIAPIKTIGPMYGLYQNMPSPIPEMTMKNTSPRLNETVKPATAKTMSITAPNFYSSTIPYTSPHFFAPFVVGGHAPIPSKSIRPTPQPKTEPIRLETIIKRGHDWLVQETNKGPRKLRPLDILATCPSCNSTPIKWSDIRNKRLAKNTQGLRCNRQAKGKCDHIPAKLRSTKRKRKREEDLADSVGFIGLGGLVASNVVQAALNEAAEHSSTRKYELLRAAFMPFLKALDPVTAARLLLDVIMSKRNKQSTVNAKKSKKSNVAPQLPNDHLPNMLTKNTVTTTSVQAPQLPVSSSLSQEQQNPCSQDQIQAPQPPTPTAVAAVGAPEPKSPCGDIEMPTIFSLCAKCNSCISYSDRFCSDCGSKVNSTPENPATYYINHDHTTTTASMSSSTSGNYTTTTADPFADVPLGIASAFF